MLASFVTSWESADLSYWTVELEQRVIGVAGVEGRDVLGRPGWNLYYRLGPEWWGHGYATEAAKTAVRAARFSETGWPITARTRASNTAAVRVAERAGLSRRQDLDRDGFVVLASNW